MRWGASSSQELPILWTMEEAEITADIHPDWIGFAQVGLMTQPIKVGSDWPTVRFGGRNFDLASIMPSSGGWYGGPPDPRRATDPAIALPAFSQCFHDSLARFGDVDVSALQLTALNADRCIAKKSCLSYLVRSLNWFNTITTPMEAIVSFNRDLIGSDDVSDLVSDLQWRNTAPFEFTGISDVPERYRMEHSPDTWFGESLRPVARQGLLATMPEWSPSAIGWTLARILDAARPTARKAQHIAIRISRAS